MPAFETLSYDEADGVARVTLNRPEVHNAFNTVMQRELRSVWRWLRRHDPVRVVILTGAGDKAFCTGIDRDEVLARPGSGPGAGAGGGGGSPPPNGTGSAPPTGAGSPPPTGTDSPFPTGASSTSPTGTSSSHPLDYDANEVTIGSGSTPFMFDDPGENLGPKSNDLWKPVIAAVNGMACGGAFYMLGEVDFAIAAEHATFFDPHLTFNMAAAYEPLQMTGRMPFGDLVRLTLLGSSERMSAARALQIGLVTEVVPASELEERAGWAAGVIARSHPAAVQSTLRALWAGRELTRSQSLGMAWAFLGLGNDPEALKEGQQRFESGERVDWRLR